MIEIDQLTIQDQFPLVYMTKTWSKMPIWPHRICLGIIYEFD